MLSCEESQKLLKELTGDEAPLLVRRTSRVGMRTAQQTWHVHATSVLIK